MALDPEELARSIAELVRWAQQHTPATESSLQRRIADHLGGDPAAMPIVTETLGAFELANLQVALDAWLDEESRSMETLGLAGMHGWRPGLGDIVRGGPMLPAIEPGPVEYASIDVGDRRIRAVRSGLFLLANGDERLAAAIVIDDRGMGESMRLEVMAADAA